MDFRLLRPLRHRDYRLLAAGSVVSLLGDGVFLASIALQVYRLSDAPTAMSVVAFVVAGSQAAVLLVGGWAADRFDRRKVLLASDLVRGLTIGAMGVLSLSGALELWHLWVLTAVQGVANGFFNPASSAIVADLVPDEELDQANALLSAARPIARTLAGPALGGVLVAVVGPGGSFLFDAATFALSAVLLAVLRTRPLPADPGALRPSLHAQVAEGLRFVRANPWLWGWIVGQSLGMLGYVGPHEVLLPYVFRFDPLLGLTEDQASLALGATLAIGGLGAIVVSLAVGQLRLPRRLTAAMYVAEAGAVGLLAVYGVMTGVWQALVAGLLSQGLYAFTEIGQAVLYQRNVPSRLLGRVGSVSWLAGMTAALVSVALAGPLAELVGARPVLIGGALVGATGLLSMLLVPRTRDLPAARVPDPVLASRHAPR